MTYQLALDYLGLTSFTHQVAIIYPIRPCLVEVESWRIHIVAFLNQRLDYSKKTNIRRTKYDLIIKLITRMHTKSQGKSIKPN